MLADDQVLVRAGFRALLDAQDDIEVVGEADDGQAALRMVEELVPDVVLMDIRMPGMDGLEATRRIVEDTRLDGTRIVILTTFDVDEYVFEALRVGASGFLVKDTEPDVLLQGVRAVARGDALVTITLHGDQPLPSAHRHAGAIEESVRERCPALADVIVHTEPTDAPVGSGS